MLILLIGDNDEDRDPRRVVMFVPVMFDMQRVFANARACGIAGPCVILALDTLSPMAAGLLNQYVELYAPYVQSAGSE